MIPHLGQGILHSPGILLHNFTHIRKELRKCYICCFRDVCHRILKIYRKRKRITWGMTQNLKIPEMHYCWQWMLHVAHALCIFKRDSWMTIVCLPRFRNKHWKFSENPTVFRPLHDRCYALPASSIGHWSKNYDHSREVSLPNPECRDMYNSHPY